MLFKKQKLPFSNLLVLAMSLALGILNKWLCTNMQVFTSDIQERTPSEKPKKKKKPRVLTSNK